MPQDYDYRATPEWSFQKSWATPEQWSFQKSWAKRNTNDINANTACLLELRARVEALEEALRDQSAPAPPAPAGYLVERVVAVLDGGTKLQARLAICEVAAHIRNNVSPGLSIAVVIAEWLEREAAQ